MIELGTMTCKFDSVVSTENGMGAEIIFKCYIGKIYLFDILFAMDMDPDEKPKSHGVLVHNDGYAVTTEKVFDNLLNKKLGEIVRKKYAEFVEWIDIAWPDGEDHSQSAEAKKLWDKMQKK